MARQEDLIHLVRHRAQYFLDTKGVTSVGVGYYVDRQTGEETEELCIQYTVEKKVPDADLEGRGLTRLPVFIEDDQGQQVRVQVFEARYKPHVVLIDENAPEYVSFRRRRRRYDAIQPGISVGHRHVTAGTLGAIVYDRRTGQPYILSNWHVLQAAKGKIGDRILQPGRADGGAPPTDVVGRLVRGYLGLAGDCAIASIEGRAFDTEILELNAEPQPVVGKAELGDRVIKSGRTTSVTRGIVKRVGVVTRIRYENVGRVMIGCFDIRPDPAHPAKNNEISMGGDSGSVWLIAEGENRGVVVGLHFAGERGSRPDHALACNIHSVNEKLGITFRPGGLAVANA